MHVNTQNGLSINSPNVKALDTGALKAMKVSGAPEDIYQRLVSAQERMLESRYTQHEDTSKNPKYAPYATVVVNGDVVAKIDNYGGTETSNAMSGKVQKAISQADQEARALQGPILAQARAEKIAELLGGEVVKSSSAMTQSQFLATPQPKSSVDYAAMYDDPAYEQLQKTKEARTLFLTQQIAQQSEDTQATSNDPDPITEFLDYMDKTPEERYYEAILNEMGLTKEELAALPPEERIEIEDKIRERIKEKTTQAASTGPADETSARIETSVSSEAPTGENGALPLEYYQLPQWYGEYRTEVSQNIGGKVDDMPTGSRAERAEYAALVNEHYKAILKDAGIETTQEHYQATVADKNASEDLRQKMLERVNNDSRLLELMDALGKSVQS